MTKSRLFALTAVLSVAIVTPAFAAGETATKPWLAPVGHRQPQATDVTSSKASSIDQAMMEENLKVDQLIKGVCRGC